MSVREPGFYWVRYLRPCVETGGLKAYPPEIAHWGTQEWAVSGSDVGADDAELEVLSHRLVPPGAPPRRQGLRCTNHVSELGYTCVNCVVTP